MKEILPALAIPMLRTPQLGRAVAHYREAAGFTLAQHVPGVVALLRHGPLCLQLWQSQAPVAPALCRVPLDGVQAEVFDIHRRLARTARAWIDGTPRLTPWGAWEFSATDAEGNCLVFVQWALKNVFAQGEHSQDRHRSERPVRRPPV